MKNDLSQTIFYLDLKHVHKYGSAKFQPNPFFSSQQMAIEHAESVAEEKKKRPKKKVGKPIRDAPMKQSKTKALNTTQACKPLTCSIASRNTALL